MPDPAIITEVSKVLRIDNVHTVAMTLEPALSADESGNYEREWLFYGPPESGQVLGPLVLVVRGVGATRASLEVTTSPLRV
jgi:hypothetical protein